MQAKGTRIDLFVPALLALMLTGPAGAAQFNNSQELAFGTIVSGAHGGTVRVSPLGAIQCSPELTCLDQGSASPAVFNVSDGIPSASFHINLPQYILLASPAGETLRVDQFEDNLGGSGQFNSLGQASFRVGATLHVESGTAPRSYSGTFEVMFAYE